MQAIAITTMLLQAIEHAVDRCLAASAADITSDDIRLESRRNIGRSDTLDYSDQVYIEYTSPEECSLVLYGDKTTKVFKCIDTPDNIRIFKYAHVDLAKGNSYQQRGAVSYGWKSFQIIKKAQSQYGADRQRLTFWRTIKTPLKFTYKFTLRQTDDPPSTPPTA